MYLHSTVVLLKLTYCVKEGMVVVNLHSTVVLLKLLSNENIKII